MKISRKQITALFICSLIPWSVGYGLLPLLPVYATQMGASTAVSGYFLAVAYLAITLGAFSAGWVSDGFHRRKLPLIITGVINIFVLWLMGQANTIGALMLTTALLWYIGGLTLALISILTGLSAGETERGKIFGLLALTMGLGMLLGGLGVGWLVDMWGYTAMFTILAIFGALFPLIASLLEEKEVKATKIENAPDQKLPGLGKNYFLFFTATILSSMTGFFAMLIRSIVMDELNFSPLEITSTVAIAGVFAMLFPLLMGWLSDRMGRKGILIGGYLVSLTSFILLAFSRALWNFWLVFIGQGITTGITGVGNALVTDLVPRQALGKALAMFGSATWIGGMVGFALAGNLMEYLGLESTFIIGGLILLAAIGLLILIQNTSATNAPDEPA